MAYAVTEIFKTLQGEGAQSGRAAVFCRFSGCNQWSGREEDRATAACTFCDTDFVGMDGTGGGKFSDAQALAEAIEREWAGSCHKSYVVLTGGKPLLQVDDMLVKALHGRGFEIGVETNGTQPAPAGIDWMCVSPKRRSELTLRSRQELKLAYPQAEAKPEDFAGLEFEHFFLQPMASPEASAKMEAAIGFCTDNPQWRLSIQSHKMIGIR